MYRTIYRALVALSMIFWTVLSAAGISVAMGVEGAEDLLIAVSFPAAVSTVGVGLLSTTKKERP